MLWWRFPRTVCHCPGEVHFQDCFALISVVVVLPQSVRYAVGFGWCVLEGFSQNGALVVLVEVLPGPACDASVVLLDVGFSLMVRVVWLFWLCVLVKVLPRIACCRSWRRFFPRVLCVRFGHRCVAPVVRKLSRRCCRLDCLYCSLLGHCQSRCVPLVVRLAAALASCPIGRFQVSRLRWWDFVCVPVSQMVCFVSRVLRALPDGGLVSVVVVRRVVLLMGASVLRCGFPSPAWKRLVMCVSFLYFFVVAQGGDAPMWCCVAKHCGSVDLFVPLVVEMGFCYLPK
ncbi:hypothetical protein Taro_005398 [Colocasia esculenta]|uniref:Uncharacterized protein n=1 Tax=Colocasia esculenta TaxID=4460 RepID=A0A843TPT4_COLES|nr:hypothetical protein [Colocasia esculenta]